MLRRPPIFILFLALGVAVDLLTKRLLFTPGHIVELIPGILHLTPAQNHGVAFSMLHGRPLEILSLSGVLIVVMSLFYWKLRHDSPRATLVALNLVLTGAFGNLIDRLALGYVRDFIDFVPPLPIIGHWAIFNVADVCICTGSALFIVAEFFLNKPAPVEELKPAQK